MDIATHSAFAGDRRIASGDLAAVVAAAHAAQDDAKTLLVFRHADGAVVDIDTRGSLADKMGRLSPATPAGRGRPRLGVVPREVTLLPRHWDWLALQPGGASAALRRLIDAARREDDGSARAARDAAYRFMVAIAGDLPGFEAASRALFAGDQPGLAKAIAAWPADIGATMAEIAAYRAP